MFPGEKHGRQTIMTVVDLNVSSARRAPLRRSDAAPDPTLLVHLNAISKSTRQLVAMRLAEVGVIVGQDQLIDYLDPVQPRSGQDAALALSVRPSTVSKMLDRLQQRGWITRAQDHGDMRKTLVLLTESGVEAKGNVHRVWAAVEAELTNVLGADLSTTCLPELARVSEALSQRLSRLR